MKSRSTKKMLYKRNCVCFSDCYYNGKKYAYGEKYEKDACNYCKCGYDGVFKCTADTCHSCKLTSMVFVNSTGLLGITPPPPSLFVGCNYKKCNLYAECRLLNHKTNILLAPVFGSRSMSRCVKWRNCFSAYWLLMLYIVKPGLRLKK